MLSPTIFFMLTRSVLFFFILAVISGFFATVNAQDKTDERAQVIVSRAIQVMGGDRYLHVTSQVGRGKYSVFQNNAVVSFQSFIDVIVFPDKERTEFRGGGTKTIQTNSGRNGWVYDGDQELIKVQTEKQVANFVTGLRVSLDNLLRGYWKEEAELSYVGRRPASLGKRNDVVRLTYKDGVVIEFEFADDGTPAKSVYKHTAADGSEVTEEDRYAQFIDVGGIKTPFIIDRYTNGAQNSRINYDSVEFNQSIADSIFAKPLSPKELKKDLKI